MLSSTDKYHWTRCGCDSEQINITFRGYFTFQIISLENFVKFGVSGAEHNVLRYVFASLLWYD